MQIMEMDFRKRSIYAAIAGSYIYGTNTEASDVDIKVIFIPASGHDPAKLRRETIGSLLDHFDADSAEIAAIERAVAKKIISRRTLDTVFLDLKHFLQMADIGNGGMIDMLYVEPRFHILTSRFSDLLLANRHIFLAPRTRLCYYAFALSHLAKTDYFWQGHLNGNVFMPITRELFGLPQASALPGSQILALQQLTNRLESWLSDPNLMPDGIKVRHNAFAEVTGAWYDLINRGFYPFGLDQLVLRQYSPAALQPVHERIGSFRWAEIVRAALSDRNDEFIERLCREWHYRCSFRLNLLASKALTTIPDCLTKLYSWCSHMVRRLRIMDEITSGEPLLLFRGDRDAQTLLDIKNGLWSYERVLAEVDRLNSSMNAAFMCGRIPKMSGLGSNCWDPLFQQMLDMASNADDLRETQCSQK